MNRADRIAKLDLEQAKANFEIERDEARHDEPPKMDFDRLGICKHCHQYQITFGSHHTYFWCKKTMGYWRRVMVFCEDNAKVTAVMEKYYEC